MGSSPLARGPPQMPPSLQQGYGLIPARAGTTNTNVRMERRERAHPRSRGDHIHRSEMPMSRLGSSPLARGPLNFGVLVPAAMGLIPARAGTTRLRFCGLPWWWAHPRSRGDHERFDPGHSPDPGSSPLARGPQVGNLHGCRLVGLIPARAGTTCRRGRPAPAGGAHPRSRGDHWRRTLERAPV